MAANYKLMVQTQENLDKENLIHVMKKPDGSITVLSVSAEDRELVDGLAKTVSANFAFETEVYAHPATSERAFDIPKDVAEVLSAVGLRTQKARAQDGDRPTKVTR